jgi:hypothetical protein
MSFVCLLAISEGSKLQNNSVLIRRTYRDDVKMQLRGTFIFQILHASQQKLDLWSYLQNTAMSLFADGKSLGIVTICIGLWESVVIQSPSSG